MDAPTTPEPGNEEVFNAATEFARLIGLNKSSAVAFASLYAADNPLSLDDITEQTGVAKSSNSVILKNLEQLGLIEAVHQANSRRKYYTVVSNPGDAIALLIAKRIRRLKRCQQDLYDSDTSSHSTAYENRVNQLKSIYMTVLGLSDLLNANRGNTWKAQAKISESITNDLRDQEFQKIPS